MSVYIGRAAREIAIAKAKARVHGPFMDTCTACGERYWPMEKEKHLLQCAGKPAPPEQIKVLGRWMALPKKPQGVSGAKAPEPAPAPGYKTARPTPQVKAHAVENRISTPAPPLAKVPKRL